MTTARSTRGCCETDTEPPAPSPDGRHVRRRTHGRKDSAKAVLRSSPAPGEALAGARRSSSPGKAHGSSSTTSVPRSTARGVDRTGPGRSLTRSAAFGGEAVANGEDVSDWDGAQRLIHAADRRFGGLDVLVNNAGILRDRMLVNMTDRGVGRGHPGSPAGHVRPTRWAAAYWRERSKAGETIDARIINTSSSSGIYGNPGQTNYGAAKSGIAAFTDHRRRGARSLRVTVNAIAPGRARA